MAKKKNVQYNLFDEQHPEQEQPKGQTPPPDEQPINIDELQNLFTFSQNFGIYFPLGNENIVKKCRAYHANNIGKVEKYLNASGLTPETMEVVKRDYLIALCGYYNFTATPDQMAEALEHLKPNAVFMIDRYGFYRLLLNQYYRFARVVFDYVEKVKGAPAETQQRYIETFPAENLRGAAWAMQRGIIALYDFKGVPAQTVATFADTVRYVSELIDYGSFYHICKYAYLAAPEDLESIRPPEGLKKAHADGFTNFLDDFCEQAEQGLDNAADMYTEAMENPDIAKWSTIKVSKNLNAIMQRPIEASKTRKPQYQTDTLPIRNHIEAFLLRPQNGMFNNGLLTEDLLQRAIGGLDLMRTVCKFQTVQIDNNKIYVFHTNITEFSELCGMKDANQKEKLALFGCLMLLKDIYIRTSFPYRVRETSKGRKYTVGGDEFVQVANIPRFHYDATTETIGKFTIHITANDLGGELMPITAENFLLLRKEAKGKSERRFQAQLIGKSPHGNKNENDLVDECFGFADMLKYATPEDEKGIKKYIKAHRAAARKKVLGWFEKYLKLGFITSYTRTQNRAGDWVYKWERPDPTKQLQAPAELITDAEIIPDNPQEQEQEPTAATQ